jgi:hypothetical protein
MNRTFILASGVVCWTVVAVDALVHLLDGDLLVPAVMAAVFVLWVGLRLVQARQVRAIPVVADRG